MKNKETQFEAGQRNGAIHDLLSPFWKAENEKQIQRSENDITMNCQDWLYWRGYAIAAAGLMIQQPQEGVSL
jgi:hypothetical protein